MSWRKVWAFYRRDLLLAATYPFSFVMDLSKTLFTLLLFFFIGRLVGAPSSTSAWLAPYGGDYFRFVLVGMVFSGFTAVALTTLSSTIAFEKASGTLEMLFLTPTSFATLAIGKTLWQLTSVALKSAGMLALGILFLDVDLRQADWVTAFAILSLTILVFFGLGLFAAGVLLRWRESGVIERLMDGVSRFLGGVYFPVSVLPSAVQKLSALLPLTWGLEGLRQALFASASIGMLRTPLLLLCGATLLVLPSGALFFRWALAQARLRGTLGFN